MGDDNRISQLINAPSPTPAPAPTPPGSPPAPSGTPVPSPAPGTPPSPPSSGGSGEAVANPEQICRLGQNLENQVGPQFERLTGKVQEARQVGQGLFTSTCYPFAATYAEAVEYMEEALKTKREQLSRIHQMLCQDAQGWAMAEEKSTIKF